MKRNIFSNIVRHMINYIRRKSVSRPKVEAAIAKNRLSLTPQDFYAFLDSIKLSNYIRVETVRQLWFHPGGRTPSRVEAENAKVLRIISNYFLESAAHLAAQLAKKIRPDYKDEHHKKIREILRILREPAPPS